MPRFVILEHDHPSLHWDLMLEVGDVLWTCRLSRPPETASEAIAAQRISDHRRTYLDYEGPVSGGRGVVKRWDAGTYETEVCEPRRIAIRWRGQRLSGSAELKQIDGDRWELVRDI